MGFSYVLKLLSMNEKPRRTEIKKRYLPSGEGYDFHRSLRLFARKLLMDEVSLEELLKSAENIKNVSERNSLKVALERLQLWRLSNPGPFVSLPPVTFSGPGGLFKIRFEPDFALLVNGKVTAFHIWNTKRPPLLRRMVLAALSWLPEQYISTESAPEDFAVLSLQDGALFRLSEAPEAHAIGAGLLRWLAQEFEHVRSRIGPPLQSEDMPQPGTSI